MLSQWDDVQKRRREESGQKLWAQLVPPSICVSTLSEVITLGGWGWAATAPRLLEPVEVTGRRQGERQTQLTASVLDRTLT